MENSFRLLLRKVPEPDWTWVISGCIAILTLYVARYVFLVRRYPRGPLPLPIVGNLLLLRHKQTFDLAKEWTKLYGDPFTLWIGPRPIVMVNSWELSKEANIVKRNDFAGRIQAKIGDLQIGKDKDIVFADYAEDWEVLRKVAHSAVRKYAVSKELEKLVYEVTDEYLKDVRNGDKLDLRTLMFNIINIIIASSVFGEKLGKDDHGLEELRAINDGLQSNAPNGVPSDLIPILSIFYWRAESNIAKLFERFVSLLRKYFIKGKANYKSGTVRTFTEAVLAAKEEAEAEEKRAALYLTEGNLLQILLDLFGAGTDTSLNTLQWLFLYITNEPIHQERILKEIQDTLGDRPPTHDDRKKLPYLTSCIYETLRIAPATPLGVPHKTTCDTRLGGAQIPKDTGVIFNIYAMNHDPEYWDEPEKFKPNRFLDAEGNFSNERLPSFMTFGLGRRSCLGEKLALASVFFVAVRLLQHGRYELLGGPGSAQLDNCISSLFSVPQPHELIIQKSKFM